MTRVLIAAASAVVRAGLAALVADAAGLEVVGQAASSDALLQASERVGPDVVLLDRHGADADLVSTLLALGEGDAPPAVAVLTDDPAALWGEVAGRSSVRAVLRREAGAAEITAAVAAAAAGLVVLPAEVANALAPPLPAPVAASSSNLAPDSSPLTPREVEILGMLAEGLGNKMIARRLMISDHTVKFHVGSIMGKLGAGSRTEAVTLGVRRGLIML